MKTLPFDSLPQLDQDLLREAVSRLTHSLNKVSNPRTSAIAVTQNARYYGNNIFLSNCTLFCAEASALMASVTANDREVTKLYLAVGRLDTNTPKIVSPCGNCRQILHDFAHLNANTIDVFSTTNQLLEVMTTTSDELLPSGFKSASLGKMTDA
jgi:cytidine deaminase